MITKIKSLLLKFYFFKNKYVKNSKIFDEIYLNHKWGGNNSFSLGEGTRSEKVGFYIDKIKEFIVYNEIKSIVEFGCGDFSVMKELFKKISYISYTGYDVSKVIVDYNKINNNVSINNNRVEFIQSDCANDLFKPYTSDLLIVRQVLQHLDNFSIGNIIRHFDNYKYVLITEHISKNHAKYNIDKVTGAHTRAHFGSGVFIDKPPFMLKAQIIFKYDEDIKFAGNILEGEIVTYLIVNSSL
jgi:hypothetical protein